MKVLGLTLLTLLLSSHVCAQTYSILFDTDIQYRPIKFEDLEAKIGEFANSTNRYLSVGESHLYPNSTRNSLLPLQRSFFENSLRNVLTCYEKISDFNNFEYFKYFKRESKKVITKTKNSPAKTDFEGCTHWWRNSNTYSGFFHQYPIGQIFKADFPTKTPVSYEKGNNIAAQMKKTKGIFVSAIDMSFLQISWSRRFYEHSTTTPNDFRQRLLTYKSKVKQMRDRMELIYDVGNVYRNQYGLILSKDHFSVNDLAGKLMPKNAYIMITEQGFRINSNMFGLAEKLAQFDDERLSRFIDFVKASQKIYTVNSVFEPSADGELPPLRYGTLPRAFDPMAELLVVVPKPKSKLPSLIVVYEPSPDKLSCFKDNQPLKSCKLLFEK